MESSFDTAGGSLHIDERESKSVKCASTGDAVLSFFFPPLSKIKENEVDDKETTFKIILQ